MTTGPRILTIDIENSPAQAYVWDIFKPFISIDQIITPPRVICFAAKWHGEKKVNFHAEWLSSQSDMVEAAARYFDEADIVVTYNGDGHDIPLLNREFTLWGITSPSPFKSVDLYKHLKRREKYLSHKLAYITQERGLSGKLETGGFKLWRDLQSEDPDVRARAQRQMAKYNKRDVVTTEEVFDQELSNIKLPHIALYGEALDGGLTCPLGHTDFISRGWKRTLTRRYRQFQCKTCGRYFSDTRSSGSVGTA